MKLWDLFYNRKYYDHVISLGYNCEVAFQFFLRHGFVESSVFAWAYSETFDDLINALNNMEKIGKEDFCLDRAYMFHGKSSNIHFHGKSSPKKLMNNDEQIKEDEKELKSRLQHLADKFLRICADGSSKVFLYKYKIKTPEDKAQIAEKAGRLREVLGRLNKSAFDLVIVVQKDDFPEGLPALPAYVRAVKFFNPEDKTDKKMSNMRSWRKIMNEFYPNFKLKKEKKYKFEAI